MLTPGIEQKFRQKATFKIGYTSTPKSEMKINEKMKLLQHFSFKRAKKVLKIRKKTYTHPQTHSPFMFVASKKRMPFFGYLISVMILPALLSNAHFAPLQAAEKRNSKNKKKHKILIWFHFNRIPSQQYANV